MYYLEVDFTVGHRSITYSALRLVGNTLVGTHKHSLGEWGSRKREIIVISDLDTWRFPTGADNIWMKNISF